MNLNICRLCYENEASINIFQSVEVLDKIKVCCGTLDIEKNDGLPHSICRNCQLDLNVCHRFIVKSEAADKKMRYMLLIGSSVSVDLKDHSPRVEVKFEIKGEENDYKGDEDTVAYPLMILENDHIKLENEQIHQVVGNKMSHKKSFKPRKENLICSVCSRRCQSMSGLSVHMKSHNDERPFQCPTCNKTYKDRGTLKRHVDRNHLQKRERHFICENCGKGFYSKCDIKIHMRVHTGETPYTCQICCSRFSQLSTMLRHKRRHTDNKSYMCATCGKPFWTKDELKKHFSVHDEVRQFSCHFCHIQFKHKGSLRKHMRVHLEPNRFMCSHCGQTFNNKGNLKSHIQRKHSEKSGHCNICLKNVSNIEVHMWRHSGHRPLKCELCSSSFYETKALALHINFKHKKTDRYKCSLHGCAQSFPSKPMLLFHVAKFHDQQKPFPCEKCARSFYRKNDLARHMSGTHKERLH